MLNVLTVVGGSKNNYDLDGEATHLKVIFMDHQSLLIPCMIIQRECFNYILVEWDKTIETLKKN